MVNAIFLFLVFNSAVLTGQMETQLPVANQDMQTEEDLLKALEFFNQGNYADVISIMKRYAEKNPQDKDASMLLIKSFVYSKDCTEALNIFRKIDSVLDEKEKGYLYADIASCYIQDKRYKEAKDYLVKIDKVTQDRDLVKYLLAYVNFALKDYRGAKPLFLDLYQNSPKYRYRSAYYLAVIYQEEKNTAESIKYLESASSEKDSEEGREALRVLNVISADKERLKESLVFKPFFKIKNAYVLDSNVPEMAENEDETIKYLTNLGSVSMRWGARTDLELSGGADFKKGSHRANATITYFGDYHFLPVNSMIPRSEFDANYYDIMFLYTGARYNYDFKLRKNKLSPGLDVGVINLFTDQFGSFVHQEGAEHGPNFYLTSLLLAPNFVFSTGKFVNIKPYYRLKMDFYHNDVKDPELNSMSGIEHLIGFEGLFYISSEDAAIVRFEYDKNNADGSQWRYSGLRAGLGLSILCFSVLDLRLLVDYFVRDFGDSLYTLENGESKSRSDKRLSINMGPEFIVGNAGRVGFKYTFILNQSNIKRIYDYQRHLGMIFWEVNFR